MAKNKDTGEVPTATESVSAANAEATNTVIETTSESSNEDTISKNRYLEFLDNYSGHIL